MHQNPSTSRALFITILFFILTIFQFITSSYSQHTITDHTRQLEPNQPIDNTLNIRQDAQSPSPLTLPSQSTTLLQQQQQPPSIFSPQSTLAQWDDCHPYIQSTTTLYQRVFISESYAVWIAGDENIYTDDTTKTEIKPSIIELITNHIHHLFTLINIPFYNQLGLQWVIKSIVFADGDNFDQSWNVRYGIEGCQQDQIDTLLDSFALYRGNNISQLEHTTSLSHLFIHCPSQQETITHGRTYLNQICTAQKAVGWTNLIDPLDFITPSHILGHALGLKHPWNDVPGDVGKYSGIMDTDNQHLNVTFTGQSGRGGFNVHSDYSTLCQNLQTLFKYQHTEGFIAKDQCFKLHLPDSIMNNDDDTISTVYENSPTCGNSIKEPYEDCDVETTCCKSCRLITDATCDGSNDQCCDIKTCQASVSNYKKCSVDNGYQNGFCWRGGCFPIVCESGTATMDEVSLCPSETFFNTVNESPCTYSCPLVQNSFMIGLDDEEEEDQNDQNDQNNQNNQNNNLLNDNDLDSINDTTCTPTSTSSHNQWFQDGGYCNNDPANPSRPTGLCLQSGKEDEASPSCVPFKQLKYIWNFNILKKCTCPYHVEPTGIYTCHDASGMIVAQSFCEKLIKPTPTPCDCTSQYQWIYSQWNTTCGHTECGKGIYTRDAWCFHIIETTNAENGSTFQEKERVPDADCIVAKIPPAILAEPCDSLIECQNGFECVANPNFLVDEIIMKCTKEDELKNLTTLQAVLILTVLVILGCLVLLSIGCIWVKCHIPPFHGKNPIKKRKKHHAGSYHQLHHVDGDDNNTYGDIDAYANNNSDAEQGNAR